MIPRKKKPCKACGSDEYIYGLGLCRWCLTKLKRQESLEKAKKKRDMEPIQAHTSTLNKKWGNGIKKRKESRIREERAYSELCMEIDKEAKESGNFKCFFCGKEITEFQGYDHHHLDGRIEERLTDKSKIVLAHQICHYKYHNISVDKMEWFKDFIERLRDVDESLVFKEENKLLKT